MPDLEIADAHQHIGDLGEAMGSWPGETPSPEEELRLRLEAMDAQGVAWAVIQPSHSYGKADGIRDTQRVNDAIAAYRQQAPERFPVALGTVEPSHGERSLAEIERGKRELALDGMSWHHRFQGGFIDSPPMRPYLQLMQELGLVPVVHTNSESNLESPWQLQKLAYEFPGLTFIALDAFFSYEQTTQVLFMAERTPNVIWDLGGPYTPALFGLFERAIAKVGAERFCFSAEVGYAGTGSKRPPALLEAILGSGLSADQQERILAGNLRALFGR